MKSIFLLYCINILLTLNSLSNEIDTSYSKETLQNYIKQNKEYLNLYNYYDYYRINNLCNDCFKFDESAFVNHLKDNQYPLYRMFDRLKDSLFIVPEDCFAENEQSMSENMTLLLRALYSDRFKFYQSRYIDDIYFSIKGDINQQLNAYEAIQLLKSYSLFKQTPLVQEKILAFEKSLKQSILNSKEFKNYTSENFMHIKISSILNLEKSNLNLQDFKNSIVLGYQYITNNDKKIILSSLKERERNNVKIIDEIMNIVQYINVLYIYDLLYEH